MHVALSTWPEAFLFTQAIEVPIYVLAMRHAIARSASKFPTRLGWQLAVAFGASLVTHPLVWFVIPRLPATFADPMQAYVEYVVRAEAFAVAVEAFYFRLLGAASARRALVWSLLANGLSAGSGFALRYLLGGS